MIPRGRALLSITTFQHGIARIPSASMTCHGRTATYRRLSNRACSSSHIVNRPLFDTSDLRFLSSPLQPVRFPGSVSNLSFSHPFLFQQLFQSSRFLHQQSSQPETTDNSFSRTRTDHAKSESSSFEPRTDQSAEDKDFKDREEGSSKSETDNEHKKEEAPPTPPHGDKSAWQVFAETLRSEFKASKEWNESTKALASSAHQFSESDSVKRARAAYSAASGAATSRTSEALKSTGKAIGHGAAWTWETPVVRGIRGGVNATGRGIEKATRPVRDTKAFQSIKETMDDGSSSRYGGWVEKEERRKKKESRELKQSHQQTSKPEKMEEDPK